VADGVSPLADARGGDRLLSEKLTIIDDATIPGRPDSRPFDDEGTPTARIVLVDAGRVENFLLDLFSAAELGLAPTGSAERDLAAPPAPVQSNLIVAPGDTPLGKMIADVGEGLLVDYLMGVGQGNLLAGDYANTVGLGFAIRDGQIVGRVKDVSLAGNVYADLREVAAVEERNHWRGRLCLPHVRIDGISVSG
jgi:PmbA protein